MSIYLFLWFSSLFFFFPSYFYSFPLILTLYNSWVLTWKERKSKIIYPCQIIVSATHFLVTVIQLKFMYFQLSTAIKVEEKKLIEKLFQQRCTQGKDSGIHESPQFRKIRSYMKWYFSIFFKAILYWIPPSENAGYSPAF